MKVEWILVIVVVVVAVVVVVVAVVSDVESFYKLSTAQSEIDSILEDITLLPVRPKIRNREKHQEKHGKYPKKLGKK